MNDDELETQSVAGNITLVLQYGSPEEREGLLTAIGLLCGKERANELNAQYPRETEREGL